MLKYANNQPTNNSQRQTRNGINRDVLKWIWNHLSHDVTFALECSFHNRVTLNLSCSGLSPHPGSTFPSIQVQPRIRDHPPLGIRAAINAIILHRVSVYYVLIYSNLPTQSHFSTNFVKVSPLMKYFHKYIKTLHYGRSLILYVKNS